MSLHGEVVLAYLKNRRIAAIIISVLSLFLLFTLRSSFLRRRTSSNTPSILVPSHNKIVGDINLGQSFWPRFYSALVSATPRCALPHEHIEALINPFRPSSGDILRQSLINLDEPNIEELTASHSWFVSQISSSNFPEPAYKPGSNGIVMTAGGEFLPEALVSIRMLRHIGSTLPVDVFIADEAEEEPGICETVLKDLGATCHTLSRIIDAEGLPRRQNITRYQLKAFALLFSQYDNIAWLDADQFALVDPLTIFQTEPFTSKGLITWPDYWCSTASPLFFRIASIPSDRIPSTGLRAASETGQLFISKSQHLRTLELVAYYNFHGPSHYYKLLSQGAVGEGDKETFLAAALALNAPFWAVETPIDTIGWRDAKGEFQGTGLLQANPVEDYTIATHRDREHPPDGNQKVSPAFLHSERHKPNAGRFSPVWRQSVNQRMWTPKSDMLNRFHGDDLERVMWNYIVWTACGKELSGYVFRDWTIMNSVDGGVCRQAKAVYEDLFKVELMEEGIGGWTEDGI